MFQDPVTCRKNVQRSLENQLRRERYFASLLLFLITQHLTDTDNGELLITINNIIKSEEVKTGIYYEKF